MPLWIKNSIVVLLSIIIAAWFAGERIRALNEKYILDYIREDKIRAVQLLAGLVANSVVARDEKLIDIIIKEYLSSWPEITYVNVDDDKSRVIYSWQKRPISFGPTVRHFEQPVIVGGQEFGTLSVYFDLAEYYSAAEEHIEYSRRSAASILLAITLLMVFLINYVAKKEGEKTGEYKIDKNNIK